MTTATAILRKEHQSILRMLDVTERVARWLERGGQPEPSGLEEIVKFFQLFLHRWHRDKEERVLFPLLEEKGLSRQYGRLQGLLCEHEHGQLLVKQLVAQTAAYARDKWGAGARWAEAAWEYTNFMRRHIAQEERDLFGVVEYLLTDGEQEKLAAAFEDIERDFVIPREPTDDETAEFAATSIKK